MPLRIPPGRSGRIWLVKRLEIAARGAELLDRKRQALIREQARRHTDVAAAEQAWAQAAREAAKWNTRAAVLDGPGRLSLLAQHVTGEATIELAWTNLMGAHLPTGCQVTVTDAPPVSALGGSAATVLAARACAEATRAAARLAVARRAEAELSAELARSARRLRALQERWIPEHQRALEALDLALDEAQREQAARARWLSDRRAGGPAGSRTDCFRRSSPRDSTAGTPDFRQLCRAYSGCTILFRGGV